MWFNTELVRSGGGERLSLEVVRCLAEAGIRSSYLVYRYDKAGVFGGDYDYLDIIHMDDPSAIRRRLGVGLVVRIFWLRRMLKKLNPDIVITQGTWLQVIDLYLATLFTVRHYVVHIFGSIFAFSPRRELTKYATVFRKHFHELRAHQFGYGEVVPTIIPRINMITRLRTEIWAYLKYVAVRKALHIFVLSRSNEWEVAKLYQRPSIVMKGAFRRRIFDYEPEVDMRERLDLSDKKLVLTISRLASNKRVDLCIRGFEKVAKLDESLFLLIGGKGDEESNLKALVNELEINSRVKFVGYVEENELWDYYLSCDVFVHMDLADFDIAPFEALALGRKVVWSSEMEIDSVLDNYRNRFIFSSSPTVHDTSESIREALTTNPTASEVISIKKKLSQYSWEKYSNEMVKHLEAARRHEP